MKNLRDADACLFLEERVATIRYFISIQLGITPVNIRVYIYILTKIQHCIGGIHYIYIL